MIILFFFLETKMRNSLFPRERREGKEREIEREKGGERRQKETIFFLGLRVKDLYATIPTCAQRV